MREGFKPSLLKGEFMEEFYDYVMDDDGKLDYNEFCIDDLPSCFCYDDYLENSEEVIYG